MSHKYMLCKLIFIHTNVIKRERFFLISGAVKSHYLCLKVLSKTVGILLLSKIFKLLSRLFLDSHWIIKINQEKLKPKC